MSTKISLLTVIVLMTVMVSARADPMETKPSMPPVYLSVDSVTLYLGQDRDEVADALGGPGTITTSERPLGTLNIERFDDGTRIDYYSFNERVAYLETSNPNVSTILSVHVGDWTEDVMERNPSLLQFDGFLLHPVHLIPNAPEDPLTVFLVLIVDDQRISGMALTYPID